MKLRVFEISCIMTSDYEVQQVQKAMNEYGVTDKYRLPKRYAHRPPRPESSDPLAASTIVVYEKYDGTTSVTLDSSYRLHGNMERTTVTVKQFVSILHIMKALKDERNTVALAH